MYSELGRLRANRRAKVVVAGCVAQAGRGKRFLKGPKNVDFVLGPQALHRLPKLLRRISTIIELSTTIFQSKQSLKNWPSPVSHKASCF